MYESTLFILPLYSISLLSLTATFRLIARCRVVSGRFGCCCDDGEDDNLTDHLTKNRGSNKKVPLRRFINWQMQRVSGNSQGLISTGSTRLDQLLGGGIRAGMLTDIYGESGSGKTQLCFTLAANCIKKNNGKVIFVDTAGTFRPERILEIGGSSDVLEGVMVLRAFGTGDQQNILKKVWAVTDRADVASALTAQGVRTVHSRSLRYASTASVATSAVSHRIDRVVCFRAHFAHHRQVRSDNPRHGAIPFHAFR